MLDALLFLEDGAADEADDEGGDEDPELPVVLQSAVVADELLLAGVVTREEKSPRAHEKIGADQRGRQPDDGLAQVNCQEAADDSRQDRDDPEAPDSVPAGGARDQGEDEGACEEAASETEQAKHELHVSADQDASNDTQDDGDNKDDDDARGIVHPAHGEGERGDESDDENGSQGGHHVGEPAQAAQRDDGARDEVDEADDPLVLVQPLVDFVDVDADLAASIMLQIHRVLASLSVDGHALDDGGACLSDRIVTQHLGLHGPVDGVAGRAVLLCGPVLAVSIGALLKLHSDRFLVGILDVIGSEELTDVFSGNVEKIGTVAVANLSEDVRIGVVVAAVLEVQRLRGLARHRGRVAGGGRKVRQHEGGSITRDQGLTVHRLHVIGHIIQLFFCLLLEGGVSVWILVFSGLRVDHC